MRSLHSAENQLKLKKLSHALQKTTSIALVVPESSFAYIGKIINGILNVAKIYKYNINVTSDHISFVEEPTVVDWGTTISADDDITI